ncbi:4-hydroxy-3-methylbut-2-enyl diphosphate reductase [bacterium]|nr:4-hydroxy-3-methylbut-2-enyl diphosphate reductase [bacterium]
MTIESKAKPCPGVIRAITLTEEVLRRGDVIFSVGQLIHNRREVERLQRMGLQSSELEMFSDLSKVKEIDGAYFLVRTHGESEDIFRGVKKNRVKILDTTCPIVRHSQEIIDQHVQNDWHIIIAGNKEHPEVKGLLTRTHGLGMVVSSKHEAEDQDIEEHTLLLAQTTIDPILFTEVCSILSKKLTDLKVIDTTCRFIRNRQNDIRSFSAQQDVVLVVGGKKSANCHLLYHTALEINKRSYVIEEPEEIVREWFGSEDRVGISGGASTPRWQLEEMKMVLDNLFVKKTRKG